MNVKTILIFVVAAIIALESPSFAEKAYGMFKPEECQGVAVTSSKTSEVLARICSEYYLRVKQMGSLVWLSGVLISSAMIYVFLRKQNAKRPLLVTLIGLLGAWFAVFVSLHFLVGFLDPFWDTFELLDKDAPLLQAVYHGLSVLIPLVVYTLSFCILYLITEE